MRLSRIWRILQIKEGVIHRGRRPRWITSSSCGGLHFWRHFDVIGSIIFGQLYFWRHRFNMAKILSKFGEQQLVMVNYACGFNQSETGKYFGWIIILIDLPSFQQNNSMQFYTISPYTISPYYNFIFYDILNLYLFLLVWFDFSTFHRWLFFLQRLRRTLLESPQKSFIIFQSRHVQYLGNVQS